MKKVIVVCGPTATGKSDYAVALAKKVNGEIISADSRQVYKGMDIGSGKITLEEMQGVPHHLLDVVDPKETFSVADYQQRAIQIIDDIIARGHTPIICGGTGLYIDAIVCGTVFPAVPPNTALREKLQTLSTEALAKQLEVLDPRRFALIDTKNKVRLIRAIEIATVLGSVPETVSNPEYDVEWHYRDFPDAILKKRIIDRLLKRLDQGMIEEVQTLHASGVSWERLESFGLEYRYVAEYLQGKRSHDDMVETLKRAIWQYVKRQRTWFKKYIK